MGGCVEVKELGGRWVVGGGWGDVGSWNGRMGVVRGIR